MSNNEYEAHPIEIGMKSDAVKLFQLQERLTDLAQRWQLESSRWYMQAKKIPPETSLEDPNFIKCWGDKYEAIGKAAGMGECCHDLLILLKIVREEALDETK